MKLSIIIPCYNEELTLPIVLREIEKQQFDFNYEILIVDDGSKQKLSPFIKDFLDLQHIHYYRFRNNMGKGTALQLGIQKAKGEYIIFQDADMEYFPSDIPDLLYSAENQDASAIYGTRFMNRLEDMSHAHFLGNKFLTKLTNKLYGGNLTDMETGYKLIKKSVIISLHLQAREFEIEPEITVKLIQKKYRIIEIPIKYKYRLEGEAKINPLDGIEALYILIKYRFFPKTKLFDFWYFLFKFYIKKLYMVCISYLRKYIK